MRRMASVARNSRSSGTLTDSRSRRRVPRGAYYVLCINNHGYPSSLDVRKVYVALPDRDAARHAQIRVVDESGDDYLFPRRYFVDLPLPRAVRRALVSIS